LNYNEFLVLSATPRDTECNMNKVQRDARAQRAKMLLDTARWWEGRSDGRDNDHAARLRAEARTLAKDPDFANMPKQAAHYTEIANTVTAENEALHDRQSAKAKMPRPRPWHAAANPILDELRGKHPRMSRSDLRRELEKQLEKSELPSADAIDDYIKKREDNGSLAKNAK
jgi:hypothetical protein